MMPGSGHLLDEASIRSDWMANGYLIIENALPSGYVEFLGDTHARGLERFPELAGGAHAAKWGDDPDDWPIAHLVVDTEPFHALMHGPVMTSVLTTALGDPDEVWVISDIFRCKRPGSKSRYEWHRDSDCVPVPHLPYISVWCAIDPATRATGCLEVCSIEAPIDPRAQVDPCPDATEPRPGVAETARLIEVDAGAVVVFSSLTWHRSGQNVGTTPRRAHLLQLAPERAVDADGESMGLNRRIR